MDGKISVRLLRTLPQEEKVNEFNSALHLRHMFVIESLIIVIFEH